MRKFFVAAVFAAVGLAAVGDFVAAAGAAARAGACAAAVPANDATANAATIPANPASGRPSTEDHPTCRWVRINTRPSAAAPAQQPAILSQNPSRWRRAARGGPLGFPWSGRY